MTTEWSECFEFNNKEKLVVRYKPGKRSPVLLYNTEYAHHAETSNN